MKGHFFARPIEWILEIDGEHWIQGDKIVGTLTVKNHSADNLDIGEAGVALTFGDFKKVHAKTTDALANSQSNLFPSKTILNSHSELQLSFQFELDKNCAITDKKSSFFISYGQGAKESHLQLRINPHPLFSKIAELLDHFHRFKVKEVKAQKNAVEFKLIPPESRDLMNVEALELLLSFKANDLNLVFNFTTKKLDVAAVTTKVAKEKVKIEKIMTPTQYSLGKDMINQDKILSLFQEVLSSVKSKGLLGAL